MLIIRLQRVGKKNEPTFRIVLTDSKNGPKSGKFLEILGSYDARDKNESKVNGDRVKELIANGAQVSDTIRNFLITKGIIEGDKVNVLPKKTPIIDEEKIKAEEEAKAAAEAEAQKESETPAEEAPAEGEVENTETESTTEETKTEEVPVEESPKEEVSETETQSEEKIEAAPEPVKEEEKPAEETPEENKEA